MDATKNSRPERGSQTPPSNGADAPRGQSGDSELQFHIYRAGKGIVGVGTGFAEAEIPVQPVGRFQSLKSIELHAFISPAPGGDDNRFHQDEADLP